MMSMSNITPLRAQQYAALPERGTRITDVQKELKAVIYAEPTSIRPEERQGYLDAILDDLEDREDAPWVFWPEDVYVQALTAIKTLARNPIGCETILTKPHFATLLHHTALPFPPSPSPFSQPPPPPTSPAALEALRCLANLVLLHDSAKDAFILSGGTKAVARALAGKTQDGGLIEEDTPDRLFLLGRIGFVLTQLHRDTIRGMVEKEDLAESLAYHLASLPVADKANHLAISELLKFTMIMLRSYPSLDRGASDTNEENWDERFDALLWPALCIVHDSKSNDLAPPLSVALGALLNFPFLARSLPTWHCIPESTPSSSSGTSSGWSLFNKVKTATTRPRRTKSGGSTSSTSSNRTKSPSPTFSPTLGEPSRKPVNLPAKVYKPSALPAKILKVFHSYHNAYIPFPKTPDDELQEGLMIDASLTPLLLLLYKAALGSIDMRIYLKETLLPASLDRSPEAGTLESRTGTLGSLLRLMNCSHTSARNAAGDLLWSICNSDASTVSAEIGYGNAAGLLFRKGISQPPPGRIEAIDDAPSTTSQPDIRHPITSLQANEKNSDLSTDMTDEEKMREHEKLLVLFDRMERNPVISAQSGDGEKKSVREVLRENMAKKDAEGWEKEEEEERKRMEEEERKDGAEAYREIEAYRRRTAGRSSEI